MNHFVVAFFGFFLAVQASSSPSLLAPRAILDVWDPRITQPKNDTIWCIGGNGTVMWDPANAPKQITNAASSHISLHVLNRTNTSIPITLAKGVNISSGVQNVTIPTNTTPGEYQVTLFGDSGNDSPPFKIESCSNISNLS